MPDDSSRMLRFKELRDLGIVRSWPNLKALVTKKGFPPGYRLGAQTRAWRKGEVDAWIDSQPVAVDHQGSGRASVGATRASSRGGRGDDIHGEGRAVISAARR